MAYLAFARKWRPSRFDEVVGQKHVITTLQNAIAVQRIGHAYLFSGPRGVGKTTIARIFAKAVNCLRLSPEDPHPEPCNECDVCVQIQTGKSLDVIEIDAASNRGIDEIRELRENVKLAPARCRYKVYIIDEVHMLTQEAFNALLKTLEEPPGHVIFILATTERHKIPLTILSRCQPFDFTFIPHQALVERLRLICDEEQIYIDEDSLALIAEQSEGCLRDAQNILEQLTASAGARISSEEVHRWLGLGSQYLLDQLTEAILDTDLPRALKALTQLATQGADLTQCLRKLIHRFADLRRLKIDPSLEGLLNVSSSSRQKMQQQVNRCSQEQLTRTLHALVKAANDIRQYGFEQLQIESALITICREVGGVPIQEIVQRLTELEARLEGRRSSRPRHEERAASQAEERPTAPQPIEKKKPLMEDSAGLPPMQTPQPQSQSPSRPLASPSLDTEVPEDEVIIYEELPGEAASPTVGKKQEVPSPKPQAPSQESPAIDPTDPQQVWQALLDELQVRGRMLIASYLREATPGDLQDGTFTIRFHRRAVAHMLADEERRLIETCLSDMIQKPVRLKIEVVPSQEEDESRQLATSAPAKTFQARRLEAERDKMVQMLLDAFEGQVIDVQDAE